MSTTIASKKNSVAMLPANQTQSACPCSKYSENDRLYYGGRYARWQTGKMWRTHRAREPIIWEVTSRAGQGWR